MHDLSILSFSPLAMSSFANALEKFLYYTVSPLTFFVQASPRGDVVIPRLNSMHREYQNASTNRVTYSCGRITSRNLTSFHQFFGMPFRNIHHQFSFSPSISIMILNVAYESLVEQAVFRKK